MGGVRVRDLFEILQRPGGLCRRRTEGIVRQWIVRIVTRMCDDVIGDIVCLRDMGRTIVAVPIARIVARRTVL